VLEDFGWGLLFDYCPGVCGLWAGFTSTWPAELEAYVGTGQGVVLVGQALWFPGGVEGCFFADVTSFSLKECSLPVEALSLGALKARYR
jgi:hypothetical protein